MNLGQVRRTTFEERWRLTEYAVEATHEEAEAYRNTFTTLEMRPR